MNFEDDLPTVSRTFVRIEKRNVLFIVLSLSMLSMENDIRIYTYVYYMIYMYIRYNIKIAKDNLK